VVTDGSGYGRSTLRVTSFSGDIQGTVCLAPSNNPCQTFYVLMVSPSTLRLEKVSGSVQAIPTGQSFQPIWVRVTDSATPANPVIGATVTFHTMLFAPYATPDVETNGESVITQHPQKILLGSAQTSVLSDPNGLASLSPWTAGLNRALNLQIEATAGTNAALEFELQVLPQVVPALPGASNGTPRRTVTPVVTHQQPMVGATPAKSRTTFGRTLEPGEPPHDKLAPVAPHFIWTTIAESCEDNCQECAECENCKDSETASVADLAQPRCPKLTEDSKDREKKSEVPKKH
jgi:hypothetical protein